MTDRAFLQKKIGGQQSISFWLDGILPKLIFPVKATKTSLRCYPHPGGAIYFSDQKTSVV